MRASGQTLRHKRRGTAPGMDICNAGAAGTVHNKRDAAKSQTGDSSCSGGVGKRVAGRRNCCAARVRLPLLIPVPATGRTLSRTRMVARRLRPSYSAAPPRHASRRGAWLSYALRASPRCRAPAAALFALQPALRMRLWRSAGSSASIAPGRAVHAWRRRASVHPGAPPRCHVHCPRPLCTVS